MKRWLRFVLPALLATAFFTTLALAKPSAPDQGGLTMTGPLACPGSGCAAGQRLNFSFEFNLSRYDSNLAPANVQVCFYTPSGWGITLPEISSLGGLTGATYAPDTTSCGVAPSADYSLAGGASTAIATSGNLGDSLSLAFRLAPSAANNGMVIARVYEQDASGWTQTTQTFKSINVTPLTASVFVANDATACGSNTPCYVNSADDLSDGRGTGLKDAADAVNAGSIITVLGRYALKASMVVVPQVVTIQGSNYSTITYDGDLCSNPMLDLQAGVTLKNLAMDDGACTLTHRDLIRVSSDGLVTIDSNDLTGGANAIHIRNFLGNVLVRFNQVSGNSGYAILVDPGSQGSGTLTAVANNLTGNQVGVQVECNQRGLVDHNFWGTTALASTSSSNCTTQDARRLGAAIQHRPGAPGVDSLLANVTTTKTYVFNNQVAFSHDSQSGTLPDFNLYIANHGSSGNDAIPFSGSGVGSISPCSNFWDVFVDGQLPPDPTDTLNLFFKYDLSSGCVATIESTSYCTNPSITPPLWWFDPSGLVSSQWLLTGPGPNGQVTACLTDLHELQVSIDATGHPGLVDDLSFVPFVAGTEHDPSAVVLSNFSVLAGDAQVLVSWQTLSEINTSGFYIQRGATSSGPFSRLPDNTNPQFFPAAGSGLAGASYTFTDTGVTNGSNYFYRLEAVNHYGVSVLFGAAQAQPNPPTATPTSTSTITPTSTSTATNTATATRTPTITPTRTPTRTPTTYRSPTTSYYYNPSVKSKTPTRTRTPTRTVTPNLSTRTALALQGSRTATPKPGPGYPGPTGQATQNSGPGYPAVPTEAPSGPAYPGTDQPGTSQPVQQPTALSSSTHQVPTQAVQTTPTGENLPPQPPEGPSGPFFWISLAAGGLLGAALLLGGGWWFFLRRITSQ